MEAIFFIVTGARDSSLNRHGYSCDVTFHKWAEKINNLTVTGGWGWGVMPDVADEILYQISAP